MRHLKQTAFACAAILMTAGASGAIAQSQPPVKIGFPVFLSGPAFGAFGEPSRNAAQLIVRAMNNGEGVFGQITQGIQVIQVTFHPLHRFFVCLRAAGQCLDLPPLLH